ncbi:MAG: hypothetical protein ABIE36_03540 [Candidatus Diapherotrites archaeon]
MKKIISIILGLLVGFHFGFGVKCIGVPHCGTINFLRWNYSFNDWRTWIAFIVTSLIVFFAIYLIWSLIQRKKMKKVVKKGKTKNKEDRGALFIPAGLFLGMGLGFLYDKLVEGLFIGLGVGFLLFALTHILKKEK